MLGSKKKKAAAKSAAAAGADGEESGEAVAISAAVGDAFIYAETETVVRVTRVDEEAGTVDVQEPDGKCRYWGDVPASTEWLTATTVDE